MRPHQCECLYVCIFFVFAVVPEQAVCKTALREYSAVQMRGVSRTSQITAKFANFDQKIANLRFRRKSGEILAYLLFWCRRIFRKLGEESKLKFVI